MFLPASHPLPLVYHPLPVLPCKIADNHFDNNSIFLENFIFPQLSISKNKICIIQTVLFVLYYCALNKGKKSVQTVFSDQTNDFDSLIARSRQFGR